MLDRLLNRLAPPKRGLQRIALGAAVAASMWLVPGGVARAEDASEHDQTAPALLSKETFARSFLLFERVFTRLDKPAPELVDIGLAFDRLTTDFFVGRYTAVRRLDQLTLRLEAEASGEPTSPIERVARSLQARVDPSIHPLSSERTPVLRIASKYALPKWPKGAGSLRMRVIPADDPDAGSLVDAQIDRPDDADRFIERAIPLDPHALSAGEWLVQTLGPDGETLSETPWSVLPAPPSTLARSLRERAPAGRDLAPDVRAARDVLLARIDYFAGLGSVSNTASVVEVPSEVLASLESEVEALRAGRDPYENRPGHLWRPALDAGVPVPMRLYVPRTDAPDRPRPLVIAMHGAGADEHMFTHAYGAGALTRLADEHDFIVASPNTNVVLSAASRLGAAIDAVRSDYAVDPDRVYLLGHSLGAGAAAGLAGPYADRLAGVVCLAGGWNFPRSPEAPPILVMAPERDAIVPARRIREIAEEAQRAGAPLTFRLIPHQTHTLGVPAMLPAAIEWLLERRRSDGQD